MKIDKKTIQMMVNISNDQYVEVWHDLPMSSVSNIKILKVFLGKVSCRYDVVISSRSVYRNVGFIDLQNKTIRPIYTSILDWLYLGFESWKMYPRIVYTGH